MAATMAMARRNLELAREVEEGLTVAEAAVKYEVSERQVRRLVRKMRHPWRQAWRKKGA